MSLILLINFLKEQKNYYILSLTFLIDFAQDIQITKNDTVFKHTNTSLEAESQTISKNNN